MLESHVVPNGMQVLAQNDWMSMADVIWLA